MGELARRAKIFMQMILSVFTTYLKKVPWSKFGTRSKTVLALIALGVGLASLLVTYFGISISSLERKTLRLEIEALEQTVQGLQKGTLIVSVPPGFEVSFENFLEYLGGDEKGEYVKELPPGVHNLKILRSGFVSFDGPVVIYGGQTTEIDFPYTCMTRFTVSSNGAITAAYFLGYDYERNGSQIEGRSEEKVLEQVVRGSTLQRNKYFTHELTTVDLTEDLYGSESFGGRTSFSEFERLPPVHEWPDGTYSATGYLSCPGSPLSLTLQMEKEGSRIVFMGIAGITEMRPHVESSLDL